MAAPKDRPRSPIDGIHIVENFYSNDPVTDALVGNLHWERETIGNASTVAYQTGYPFGVIRHTTAATADGDGESWRLFTDGLVFEGGLTGGFSFRFRYVTTLAGSNFRIGLDSSVTATEPTDGIWVLGDAGVLTLEADSADHGDLSQAFAQPAVTTLTSGTTAVVDTWHVVEVIWEGTNGQGGPKYISAYVDDAQITSGIASATTLCNLDNDESVEVKITMWQDSGGAAARIIDLDWFEFWQWRSR